MRTDWVASLLAACVVLAACTPAAEPAARQGTEPVAAASPAQGAAPTTLRWAIDDPTGITPATALDEAGLDVVDLVFDSLTAIRDDEVVPAAATTWSSQDDGRQWTFRLRPGATFHDGTPVTAADVARGWAAVAAAGHPQLAQVTGYAAVRAGESRTLRGVTSPDEATVVVQLVRPDYAFPLTASHPVLAPLPPTATEPDFVNQPIGNGPFQLAEPWALGLFIRLTRVMPPDGGTAPPDLVREIVFETTDPATGYVRFQQDRVHVATVPGGALAEAQERYGASPRGAAAPGVRREPEATLIHLGMDVDAPPLDEPEVRQALSLAIDREQLAEQVGEGDMLPARGLAPPVVPGASSEPCATCRHDPALARSLFAAHGVDTLELTVEIGAGDNALVEQLTDDLVAVGVELTVDRRDFADLMEALEAGEVPLYRLGWVTERPDLYAAVSPVVRGDAPVAGRSVNYGGYASEEVDALLDRALRTPSAARRTALVRQAAEIALDRDQAIVPLLTTRDRRIVAPEVRGLRLPAFGGPDLSDTRLVEP